MFVVAFQTLLAYFGAVNIDAVFVLITVCFAYKSITTKVTKNAAVFIVFHYSFYFIRFTSSKGFFLMLALGRTAEHSLNFKSI